MNPLRSARVLVRELMALPSRLSELSARIDEAKILSARLLIRQIEARGVRDGIRDAEFDVFSQFGDDGIIQYLIRAADVGDLRTFVEFGVGNYTEANTRFLLINDNWRGLVMDCDAANVASIRSGPLYWKYDLTAVHAFVDCENVNAVLARNGFAGEVGLLHIDIDGNDYWVWEALDVVSPVIAIVEYNSVLGPDRAVTVPYDPAFDRTRAHHSNLYWGCSLKALCRLAEKKGYAFVGANSNGNNAYFVRKDRMGPLSPVDASAGYVLSKYRESRDAAGRLTYASGDERLRLIEDMTIFDLETGAMVRVGELRRTASDGVLRPPRTREGNA